MRQMALADKRRERRASTSAAGEQSKLALVKTEETATGDEIVAAFNFALLDMEPLPEGEGVGAFLDRFQHEQGVEVDLDSIPGDALGTVVTLLELERLWLARKH